MTNDPAFDAVATLTPDDSRAIFLSNRDGPFDLWIQEGEQQRVLVHGVTFPGTPALSRDGSMVIYGTGEPRRFFAVQTRAAPRTASPRLVCDDCDVAWDVTSDNRTVVFNAKRTIQNAKGTIEAVWHFHETRRSMAGVQFGVRSIGLSRGRLMVTLNDAAGNVWLAK